MCVGSLDSYDFMGGSVLVSSVVLLTCMSCDEKPTDTFILSQNLPLSVGAFDLFWEKLFQVEPTAINLLCASYFVLAMNLDLACPLSFGKKHGLDLSNKSIRDRTLVEKHWEKSSQLPHQLLAARLSRPTCGQADND